jgi:hypothetical protein
MKRIIIIFGVAFTVLLLAGMSWAADTEKEKAAVAIAQKWLVLVDTGKYSESWREADDYFKKSVTLDNWDKIGRSIKTDTGKIISRKLKTTTYKTSFLPGEPKSQSIIVRYTTSFQKRKSAAEEVVVVFDKNGRGKVSGYHLK